jgi:oligopeptide transport system ATP-binding protein
MNNEPLLKIKNLKKYFKVQTKALKRKTLKAVDDVSFDIFEGETLGLVGESGCGKSTLGRAILNLHSPTSGQVIYKGNNLSDLRKTEMKRVRKDLQIVFQDPAASLNPRKKIEDIICEPMNIHNINPEEGRQKRISKLMEMVGLASYHIKKYPHELSGGQKQRVGIARALSMNPRFIVCDEAVSALDVSVQAQVVNLLRDLQKQLNLTYLFISHNLNVVYQISDRVIVMYLGKVMEISTYRQLYENPGHPYTIALLSAIPHINPDKSPERIKLSGDPPSPMELPDGCRFSTRCPNVMEKCRTEGPDLVQIEEGHYVACHLFSS